jgi:hypothetical protein
VAEFETAHNTEKAALGMPITGTICGKEAINSQKTTDVTDYITHPDPEDNRVIAYINGGWRNETKTGFTFLTREEKIAEGWVEDQE